MGICNQKNLSARNHMEYIGDIPAFKRCVICFQLDYEIALDKDQALEINVSDWWDQQAIHADSVRVSFHYAAVITAAYWKTIDIGHCFSCCKDNCFPLESCNCGENMSLLM
jgi:hypothetical protein